VIPGLIDIRPSPNIGPLPVGWYGVGYVVALAVLVWVTQRELARRGIAPHHVTGALVVTAILALIGGRLYHVIDDWDRYSADPLAVVLPPYAGLGLFGGVAGAIIGIVIYTRRNGIPIWRALDAVIPGTLFAQGIARWGNFFNQELYGPPTDAGWGIAIDCANRIEPYFCPGDPRLAPGVAGLPVETTGFHPLFFYESGLDIAGGFIALWLGRRFSDRLRDGDVASFWGIWYGAVRTILETFRQGYNWTLGGAIPTAQLIGIGLIVAGVLTIAWRHRRPRAAEPDAEIPVGA
jgi:phosphatidylglycerol:prolipoprotein diacylglycerol transferase